MILIKYRLTIFSIKIIKNITSNVFIFEIYFGFYKYNYLIILPIYFYKNDISTSYLDIVGENLYLNISYFCRPLITHIPYKYSFILQ